MAKDLILEMDKAYTLDREANIKNKAAINKMLLLSKVTTSLKKVIKLISS